MIRFIFPIREELILLIIGYGYKKTETLYL